ncbi:MAG: hypothetical protein ACRD1L_03830, partial [Terriglobales bacterium]
YYTVNGNTTTYFDTLSPSSTPALTVTASPNAYQPTSIVYSFTGAAGPETITEKLQPTYYQTEFGCSGVQESTGSPNQVYELDLPNGTKYQFAYDLNTADVSNVTLPTGGAITYSRSFTCASGWAGGSATLSRTDNVDNGAWSWSQTPNSGGTETAQTDPQGGVSDSFYQGGFPVSAELFAGSVAEEVNTCYNGATTTCLSSAPSLPITDRVTATVMMGSTQAPNQAKQLHQTFDGLGKPTEVDETDWFPAAQPGPYIRKTTISYQAIAGVGEIPTQVRATDSGGNRVAEADYAYDQTTPQATGGVLNHGAPPLGIRGNLTSVTRWLNLGGASPVTTVTYDDTGQPLTSTDANGNATSFSYADNYAGAPGGIVTNAFATTVTKPQTRSPNLASHVTHASFLYATGAVASSTDENGQLTSYAYADPLSRLTETDYPDSGATRFTYDDGAPQTVEVRRLLSGTWSSGTSSDSFVETDGLGREVIAASANSEATPWDRVDTCYDSAGRLLSVSYPYQASSPTGTPNCSAAGDARSYDGMNRLTKITHSDGSAINYSYAGRAVEAQDEGNGNAQPMTRIYQPDGLGRLASVCEVTAATQQGSDGAPGACGLDIAATVFLTTYSHDLLNDLIQVNQGRLAARSFFFDSLGRMTEDNSPEECPDEHIVYSRR